MKVASLIVAVIMALGILPVRAVELLLWNDGQTAHKIVIPDQYPTEQLEKSVRQAAELLRDTAANNGVSLEILPESQAADDRPAVYVGQTAFAKRQGIDFAAMEGWTYAFKVVGEDLIIAGNDEPDPIPLEQRRAREARRGGVPFYGTLKGMTEFLYNYAGVRFLIPGPHGVEFLPMPMLAIPGNLSTIRRPYMRNIEVPRSDDIYLVATGFEPSPKTVSNYGHYHQTAVTAKEYGESNPEYFVFHSQQRDNKSPHLCFSNPEVTELIYQKVLEDCDNGYDIIEMGQNDGFRPCSCEDCFNLYGIHPTTRPEDGAPYLRDPAWGQKLWIMHREMALRLQKDRPGKKLMISAYSVARPAPAAIDSLPGNAIVQMMHPAPDIFQEWSRIDVPAGFAAYTYTWGSTMPKNSIRHIEALANTLIENNVQDIQINLKPRFSGLEGGNVYVFRRMLNEPGVKSADELLSEYIAACYLEAAGLMHQFFRRLNQRMDFMHEATDYARRNRNNFLAITTIYTPDLMNTLAELLTQAEKTVVSPGAQYRLAATRIEFDYLKHHVAIIYHYYSYQLRPDDAGLERLLSAIDDRNAWLEELDQQRRNRPTFRHVKIDQLKGSTEPFNWDTAKIRAGEMPGNIRPTDPAFAMRTEGAVTLQDAAWEKAPAYQLQPNRGEKELKETTTFQLLYDQDNLYVRFDSGMQSELMGTFQPRGRDGELWLQECVNILLAPEGDKSQYYYLTYEPVADSFIDANHGYITDSLHPKFGWNDQTWDGDWTYVNELLPDQNRWLSMAVIPFKTLNAPTPKPGAVWAGNFGRVHFKEILTSTKHADRVKAREVSVWHHQLNGSRNPGDAFMADIIFK